MSQFKTVLSENEDGLENRTVEDDVLLVQVVLEVVEVLVEEIELQRVSILIVRRANFSRLLGFVVEVSQQLGVDELIDQLQVELLC